MHYLPLTCRRLEMASSTAVLIAGNRRAVAALEVRSRPGLVAEPYYPVR